MTTVETIQYDDGITVKVKSDSSVCVDNGKSSQCVSGSDVNIQNIVGQQSGIKYDLVGLNLYDASTRGQTPRFPKTPTSTACTGDIPPGEQVKPHLSSIFFMVVLLLLVGGLAFFLLYRGKNKRLAQVGSWLRGGAVGKKHHFPWKFIVIMVLLTAVVILAYVRNRYLNTISVLGTSGYKYAFAAAYPMLSTPLGFKSADVPYTVTQWMQYGRNPTPADATTIETLIDCQECTPSQTLQCVECGISALTNCTQVQSCTDSDCMCNVKPLPSDSQAQGVVDTFYKYGLPILNTALMVFATI